MESQNNIFRRDVWSDLWSSGVDDQHAEDNTNFKLNVVDKDLA